MTRNYHSRVESDQPGDRSGLPMRVAMVSPGYPPDVGGVELVVERVSHGLAQRGHTIEVLSHVRHNSTIARTVTPSSGLTIRRFPDWTRSNRFQLAPGLWRELRRRHGDFDVVNAHSFHSSAAIAASLFWGGPLVFTPHYHGVGHTPLARLLHRVYDPAATRIFNQAEAVICVSHAEAAALCDDYPSASSKVWVIPNGIDVKQIRGALPFEETRPVILSVGRLEAYKQVALTVRALRALPTTDAVLVVAGSGPELANLRKLTSDLGVADRVRFLGFVPDEELRRWLRTAAVTVTLSRHEAFGLIALEALAGGSAVVASDIAAHAETLGPFSAASRLVPPDAAPELVADAIMEILHRPQVECKGIVQWSEVCARTEAVLKSAAGASF